MSQLNFTNLNQVLQGMTISLELLYPNNNYLLTPISTNDPKERAEAVSFLTGVCVEIEQSSYRNRTRSDKIQLGVYAAQVRAKEVHTKDKTPIEKVIDDFRNKSQYITNVLTGVFMQVMLGDPAPVGIDKEHKLQLDSALSKHKSVLSFEFNPYDIADAILDTPYHRFLNSVLDSKAFGGERATTYTGHPIQNNLIRIGVIEESAITNVITISKFGEKVLENMEIIAEELRNFHNAKSVSDVIGCNYIVEDDRRVRIQNLVASRHLHVDLIYYILVLASFDPISKVSMQDFPPMQDVVNVEHCIGSLFGLGLVTKHPLMDVLVLGRESEISLTAKGRSYARTLHKLFYNPTSPLDMVFSKHSITQNLLDKFPNAPKPMPSMHEVTGHNFIK